MITAIKEGTVSSLKYWRMNLVIYFFNVVFSAVFALSFRTIVDGEYAKRDISPRLLDGFDFRFLSDAAYGSSSITSLTSVIIWLVLFYAVFSIFLSGGVISTLHQQKTYSASFFFGESARYTTKFLGVTSLFLVSLLIPILVIVLFYTLGSNAAERSMNEATTMIWLAAGILVSLLIVGFFHLSSQMAKFLILTREQKVIKAYFKGVSIIIRNIPQAFGILLIFMIILSILAILLYQFSPKASSGSGVFAIFFAQQLFIFSRIVINTSITSALLSFFKDIKTDDVNQASLPNDIPKVSISIGGTNLAPENRGDTEVEMLEEEAPDEVPETITMNEVNLTTSSEHQSKVTEEVNSSEGYQSEVRGDSPSISSQENSESNPESNPDQQTQNDG